MQNLTIGRFLDPALKACLRHLLFALEDELSGEDCWPNLVRAAEWFNSCPI